MLDQRRLQPKVELRVHIQAQEELGAGQLK